MGNCTTSSKSGSNLSLSKNNTNKRSEKQMKIIQGVREEITRLLEEQLFNQALMKMNKLLSLLKYNREEATYYQEVMELYIEMGRINQDIVCDHSKAYNCFQSAIDMSIYAYGQNNEVANKIITPFIQISKNALEEQSGPLRQSAQLLVPSPSNSSIPIPGRKYFKRSSTHATTRVSAIPPSLNIIIEESVEHEDDYAKKQKLKEKDINNSHSLYSKTDKSPEKLTTQMLTSV